jgi:hypothetical protein
MFLDPNKLYPPNYAHGITVDVLLISPDRDLLRAAATRHLALCLAASLAHVCPWRGRVGSGHRQRPEEVLQHVSGFTGLAAAAAPARASRATAGVRAICRGGREGAWAAEIEARLVAPRRAVWWVRESGTPPGSADRRVDTARIEHTRRPLARVRNRAGLAVAAGPTPTGRASAGVRAVRRGGRVGGGSEQRLAAPRARRLAAPGSRA